MGEQNNWLITEDKRGFCFEPHSHLPHSDKMKSFRKRFYTDEIRKNNLFSHGNPCLDQPL